MNRVAQHPVQAFVAALAAVGILSVMDAVMKALVLALGIYVVSIWRSVVNLILTGALYLPRRLPWPNRSILKIHVGRGMIVTVMAFLFFWGIGRVPLAQAIALTFIAPLIALLLAAVFLGELIGRRSIGGSAMAFAGVIVIVLGQARADLGQEALIGSLAILGSALCYAVNIVLMRHQSLAAKPLEINFFQSLTVLVLWLAAVPFVGVPHWPDEWWMWICVAAIMSTAGGLLFSWAYARAEASYLAVTEYSAFLWAAASAGSCSASRCRSTRSRGRRLIVGGCLVAASKKPVAPPEIEAA